MAATLRVLARGGLLVLDADNALVTGHRVYVGRQVVRAWKLEDLPEGEPRHEHSNQFLELGQSPIPHCAYPKTHHAVEVSDSSYYRKMVQKGALWPYDEATAAKCGVKFDPTFGGDYPNLIAAASG